MDSEKNYVPYSHTGDKDQDEVRTYIDICYICHVCYFQKV